MSIFAKPLKKIISRVWWAGLLMWIIAGAALYFLVRLPGFFEPDRLFHLALLRELSDSGGVKLNAWAQFPYLGWDEYFSDKEFLFHLLTLPGWNLGGEDGFLATTAFFSASIAWVPLFFFRRRRWALFAIILVTCLGHSLFFYRLLLSRPHVLAVALFTGLVLAMWRRLIPHAFIFGILFSLAYHAFFLPLAFIFLALIEAKYIRKDLQGIRTSLGAAGGIIAGLIINPYFPSNIVRSLQTLIIAIDGKGIPAYVKNNFGSELLPFHPEHFVRLFAPDIAAFLVACFFVKKRTEFYPLVILTGALWAGALITPRTLEFVAPLTAITFFVAWLDKPRIMTMAIVAATVANAGTLWKDLSNSNFLLTAPSKILPREPVEVLLNLIPKTNVSSIIFHDRWDLGSFIAESRPDQKAIDVLDPTYLWMHDPARAELSAALRLGKVEKSVEAIRRAFAADYAIASPLLAARLAEDSKAIKIGASANGVLTLFRIKP